MKSKLKIEKEKRNKCMMTNKLKRKEIKDKFTW